MKTSVPHFFVIPAQPGYRIVYRNNHDGGSLFVGEDVIAWRIETIEICHEPCSTVTPLSIDGEPSANIFGLALPDGRVSCFAAGETFPTLGEAVADSRKGER